ncbi:unnamed protein product [Mytilus coruscus]|uniref:Uncharacterized protein n=1 Tax=Mytilus coruscus TaxID=42192 RepID=A0A6J8CMR9_MYTCO|nr:unnamed protein product [Mytilus coruscus]
MPQENLKKNQTDLAIVRGTATIQNAHDLFEFAKSNLSIPKSSNCKRRLFKYTEKINRNFRMFYKPIPGIRSVHQIPIVPEIGTVDDDQNDDTDIEVPIYELVSKAAIFAVHCDDDEFDCYLLKAQTESYHVIKGNYFMQGENPLHFELIKKKYGIVPSNSC